jgi:hypothetical protein
VYFEGKAGGLRWPKLDENGFLPIPCKSLKKNGGDDGTRTRGLCRDRERLTSTFNNFESTDGNRSHCKYAVSSLIVYHVVYHESEQWNQGFNKASELTPMRAEARG